MDVSSDYPLWIKIVISFFVILLLAYILSFILLIIKRDYNLLLFTIFFLILLLAHLLVIPNFELLKYRYLSIPLTYAIIIDVFILLTGAAHFSLYLLLPALIALLLLISKDIIEYLLNYNYERSRFIEDAKLFIGPINNIRIEFDRRGWYNFSIVISFIIIFWVSLFYEWPLNIILSRFYELSVWLIAIIITIKVINDYKILLSIKPEVVRNVGFKNTNSYNYEVIDNFINTGLPTIVTLDNENILDFYDRAGDIRNLSYYSSLSYIIVMGLYLSSLSFLSNLLFRIPLIYIVAYISLIGFLFIQLPFYLGQKKLIMELTKYKAGLEYRNIIKLLNNDSPSNYFIKYTELFGASVFGPILIFILQWLINSHSAIK